jgi:hypothetical protein
VRLVTYEQGTPAQTDLQNVLKQHGLLLGEQLDTETSECAYRVPTSARPLAYDARVESAGSYSYNDRQLFFDLGRLLGGLYTATNDGLVVEGDLGKAVAFVEFSAPGERPVFLAPGAEKIVRPVLAGQNPLTYYHEQLSKAFDARFDDRSPYFNSGFSEVVNSLNEDRP